MLEGLSYSSFMAPLPGPLRSVEPPVGSHRHVAIHPCHHVMHPNAVENGPFQEDGVPCTTTGIHVLLTPRRVHLLELHSIGNDLGHAFEDDDIISVSRVDHHPCLSLKIPRLLGAFVRCEVQ